MRTLLSRLTKQDAIVCHYANWDAVNARKARNQRVAIECFELVKLRSINNTRDDFSHIERFFAVTRNNTIQLITWVERLLARHPINLLGLEPI